MYSFDPTCSWQHEFFLTTDFERRLEYLRHINALSIDLRHSHVTHDFQIYSSSNNFYFVPNLPILMHPAITKNSRSKCFRCLNYSTMENSFFLESQYNLSALRFDGFLATLQRLKLSIYKPTKSKLKASDVSLFKNLYDFVSSIELDKMIPTLSNNGSDIGIKAIEWGEASSSCKSILKLVLFSGSEFYLNLSLKPVYLSVPLACSDLCTYWIANLSMLK